MNISVRRVDWTDEGIFGHLSMPGFDCVTLENHDLEIPTGVYPVVIYDSPKAGHPVPLLTKVPGRSMIEIHPGNVETDSKGCLLVGTHREGDAIVASRIAFSQLFPLIQAAILRKEQVLLEVS